MESYNITIQHLSTLEARIINFAPPSGEQLHINLNRNIRKAEDSSFLCILTASIYREKDEAAENKDYLIKYAVKALVTCTDPAASAEELQDAVTKELYPHLRASISSIMGAAGLEPILLPPLLI